MTNHFNFKRQFLKYIIIFLLCFVCMHSFSNVKAWSNLDSQYIVNYTNEDNKSISDFLIKGDTVKLDNFLQGNFNITNFNSWYNSVKNYIYTQLGYSSWSDFTDNNYYISSFWVSRSPFTSSPINKLSIYFYYTPKTSSTASLFGLSMATTVRSSSTPTINANQTYYTQFGAIYRTGFFGFSASLSNNTPLTFSSSNSFSNVGIVNTCGSTSQFDCFVRDYDSSTKTLTIEFTDQHGFYLQYVDSNKESLNLYFAKINALLGNTDYVFQKAILNDNSNNIYNLVEPIATNILNKLNVISENVQQLSNNALGVTVNTVSNTLTGFGTNPSYSTFCSNERPFVNKVCNIYANDLLEQDRTNSDYINEIGFYFNKNEISFQGNYKVVSFRLYTPYNLQILDSFYTTNSTGNSLIPFTIISQKVIDYSLYRDYVVVLQPDISTAHNDQLTSLHFTFSYLSDFVSEIPVDYSFGVYNTIKFSSYNDTPTATDIEQEINNNPLSSISNNDTSSFFSNFTINDHGLSQFVTLPLTYITSFKNNTCSSITLPFPHLSNITIPCMSTFLSDRVPAVWNLYVVLINGFVIYRIFISLLGDIKNIHKPDNDRIEVIDL